MLIQWLGHSCFKISSESQSLIIDPFADGSVAGLRNIRETANVVLVSHLHKDHCGVENVKLSEARQSYFEVDSFSTYHDEKQGKLRGENIVHIIECEGYKIAHLGDLGCDLTSQQIEKLQGLDICMIPVGGYYTIDSKKAYEIIQQIKPKIIIPMHYYGGTFDYDVLETVDKFTKYFENVTYLTTDSFHPSDELDNEVIVLDYPVIQH